MFACDSVVGLKGATEELDGHMFAGRNVEWNKTNLEQL